MALLSEEQKRTQVEPGDALLFKVSPLAESPDTFIVETCSTTGTYEEAADKLWLVIKSLKKNEKQEVK